MWDTITYTLQQEWAIRAIVASSMVGISCGLIGCFIVLRNMSLVGDALSHAILPGVFFAFLLTGYSPLGFFVGAVIAGLITAFAITWIQNNVPTKADAAVGIVFIAMFSIGVIGISWLNNQGGVHLELNGFLFGSVLGVSDIDVLLTIIIAVVTIGSFLILYRYLFITTFQPTIASTMGVSVQGVYYFLMLMLSLAVVSALNTVGVILVIAMLITPASTALLLSDKLKLVLVISSFLGAVSAVLGMIVAVALDIPPGPAMVMVATALYTLAVVAAPEKGLIVKGYRALEQRRKIASEDIIRQVIKHDEGMTIHALSERLGISKSRISGFVDRMKRKGMVSSKDPVRLSVKGKEMGDNLVRAHRLWETYQVSTMGLSQEQIHDEADRLEHYLTGKMLDDVDLKLGFPLTDPHGSPIPQLGVTPERPLLQLRPRDRARIAKAQVSDQVESDLWELGLMADTAFSVASINRDNVRIKVSNKTIEIPALLARLINVDR